LLKETAHKEIKKSRTKKSILHQFGGYFLIKTGKRLKAAVV